MGPVYIQYIEIPYLEEIEIYYSQESAEFIEQNGIWNYLQKAISRIEEEEIRNSRYIDPSSECKVNCALHSVLIAAHKEKMSSEFLSMLQDEHTVDLHRMFLLLQRIEGALIPLTKQFLKHIQTYGFEFIQRVPLSKSLEPNFIISYSETLLEIYLKFNDLVSQTFHNHPQFVSALEEGFRIVINSNPILSSSSSSPSSSSSSSSHVNLTSAQLLAMYCDIILKTSSHVKMDEFALEKTIDRCTQLFKFIDAKDIFQKYFSVHLANRLIEDLTCGEEINLQYITL